MDTPNFPIAVTGGDFDFNLFAVWAYNPDDREGKYITQCVNNLVNGKWNEERINKDGNYGN